MVERILPFSVVPPNFIIFSLNEHTSKLYVASFIGLIFSHFFSFKKYLSQPFVKTLLYPDVFFNPPKT